MKPEQDNRTAERWASWVEKRSEITNKLSGSYALIALKEYAAQETAVLREELAELKTEHERVLQSSFVNHEDLRVELETVKAELEQTKKARKWISVKERLPEEQQEVLAYNGFMIVQKSWMDHTDQNKEWFESRFTHWMPLPELPKP